MSVIEFPGQESVPEDCSKEDICAEENICAEAFCDLESQISDCAMMAGIAAQLMGNVRCTDERLAFSVFHLAEMISKLNKHYLPAYEKAVREARS
jgi:hypothetical protein